MQKLLILSTAIVVAAAAYVGLVKKEQPKVVETKQAPIEEVKTDQEEVIKSSESEMSENILLEALNELNDEKSQEILISAAVEAQTQSLKKVKSAKKSATKVSAKNTVKVSAKKVAPSKKVSKTETKAVEDEVSTQAASTTATNTTTTALANDPLGQMGGAGVGGFMSFIGSTDFKETTDSTKSYASQVMGSIRIPLQGKYNLMVGSAFAKDLSGGFEERVNNTNITLGHLPISLGRGTIVIPRFRGIYPTSKASKVRDEMNGGVAITPIFAHQLNSRVAFTYIPTAIAYSHKFKTNRVNETNNQYVMSHTLIGTYNFTDLFSASAMYTFGQSWSYFGTEKDRQYSTDLSMMYLFKNRTNLSAGINTGGLLYDAEQGPDSNVELYNPNTTSFYLMYGIAL